MRKSRRKYKDGIYHDTQGRLIEREGKAVRLYWSKPMLDYLKANFATTYNKELSEYLGLSQRVVNRKAKDLGLAKSKEWLMEVHRRNIQLATIKNRVYRNSGMFKKGELHGIPFKAGHKPSKEWEASRKEGIRKFNASPLRRHEKALKAWATRKANMLNQQQSKEATI